MKKKTAYRLRNWSEYNRSLKQRGSLTIWISAEAVAGWTSEEKTGAPGASPTYTDLAIATMATVQAIYMLAGRQTQGFRQSVFALMKLDLSVPEHSTLSRRREALTITLPVWEKREPRHLVVDSTGGKVYSEGEWKVRQHGWSKRRTWRKLHFCVDEATLEIVAAVASTNALTDGAALPDLLADVRGEVARGDAATALTTSASVTRPSAGTAPARPSRRAKARGYGGTRRRTPRVTRETRNLRRIRQAGRKAWKREAGYHRRSLAETTVRRFKAIFGDRVRTRAVKNQFKELLLKCALLNRMTHLGMPDSYKVTG